LRLPSIAGRNGLGPLADAGKELLFQALADQTKKASAIITY
jgi:hypothetical protein